MENFSLENLGFFCLLIGAFLGFFVSLHLIFTSLVVRQIPELLFTCSLRDIKYFRLEGTSGGCLVQYPLQSHWSQTRLSHLLPLKGSQPLDNLIAVRWTFSVLSWPISIYWENQSWTGYFRCGLRSVPWRWIIISLDLLAGSLLMQLYVQLFRPPMTHSCPILNLLSIRVGQIPFIKAPFQSGNLQSA